MTSSDVTHLPEGAPALFARRVGASFSAGIDGAAPPGPADSRGHKLQVAMVCGEFNGGITARLLDGALTALTELGVIVGDIITVWVPGAFEMPLAAQRMIDAGADVVICLGAVIRGETTHYEIVAENCASGVQRVQLDTGVPVIFGVLTTENVDQAVKRSGAGKDNKGWEAAATAISMAWLLRQVPKKPAVERVYDGY